MAQSVIYAQKTDSMYLTGLRPATHRYINAVHPAACRACHGMVDWWY